MDRVMKADVPATRERKFKDPKSYVTADGREILHGDDWDNRKFELLQRSHGVCEYIIDGFTRAGALSARRQRSAPPHAEKHPTR